jgi:hypothetical protein
MLRLHKSACRTQIMRPYRYQSGTMSVKSRPNQISQQRPQEGNAQKKTRKARSYLFFNVFLEREHYVTQIPRIPKVTQYVPVIDIWHK